MSPSDQTIPVRQKRDQELDAAPKTKRNSNKTNLCGTTNAVPGDGGRSSIEMNLGDIYIKTFLAISSLGICAAVVAALLIFRLRKLRVGSAVGLALLASAFIVPLLNVALHRPLFVKWHQSQNLMVPSTGCRSYEPDFMTLHASYSMSKSNFVAWAESHPAQMRPYAFRDEKGNLELIDEQRLGFVDAELIYATKMAPNGKQLRAYFRDGIMYLSYNVM